MGGRVREVLIVKHAELLVRVLDQSEGVALGVADSQVDGAGALGLVDRLKGAFHVLGELQEISGDVGPRLAVSRLVLLDWVLLSDLFADARVLAEPSDRPDDAGESDIDEGMRPFFRQVVNHQDGVLVHGVPHVPIESPELDEMTVRCGVAPGADDGAASPRVLRNHVDLDHLEVIHARSSCNARVLIEESLGRVGQGDVVIPPEQALEHLDCQLSGKRLVLIWYFGDELELLLDEPVVVLPEVVVVLADFLLHERTVGKTSLVGVAPDADQRELLSDVLGEVHVFLSVLVALDFGEAGVDGGKRVGLALAGRNCLQGHPQQGQKDDRCPHFS